MQTHYRPTRLKATTNERGRRSMYTHTYALRVFIVYSTMYAAVYGSWNRALTALQIALSLT